MNLYILKPAVDNSNQLVWEPTYSEAYCFIVSAENEIQARELAAKHHGSESKSLWLNPLTTQCNILIPTQFAGVVLASYNSD